MKTPLTFLGALFLGLLLPLPVFAQVSPETHHTDDGKGELLVTVSSAPLLGSVPRGATRIPVAVINLSASCDEDIVVESIEVAHTGLGSSAGITAVYLTDGFRRISRSRQFDTRSRTAELRTAKLTVPKCGAVRLQALMDISSDAVIASEHGLTVAHASGIQSSALDTTLSYQDSTELIVTRPFQAGNITVNFLPVSKLLRYGRTETVARVQFSADSKNDHLLKSMLFTNKEDARDMDFIDIRLESRDGTVLTNTAARMKGSEVKLEFSPTYILERGRTMVFLLKATVHGSQRRKVNFHLEEKSDLEAVLYRPR